MTGHVSVPQPLISIFVTRYFLSPFFKSEKKNKNLNSIFGVQNSYEEKHFCRVYPLPLTLDQRERVKLWCNSEINSSNSRFVQSIRSEMAIGAVISHRNFTSFISSGNDMQLSLILNLLLNQDSVIVCMKDFSCVNVLDESFVYHIHTFSFPHLNSNSFFMLIRILLNKRDELV